MGKYLYGEGYDIHSCGTLSSKCEKFFIEENCLYECDKNVGKWRKHEDCTETTSGDNGWQIENMPIKSSYCDSWYEACKEESICAGPTRSFFEMPDCLALNKRNNNTAGCKRFKDVYTNGKDVCEVMWGNSFKYETDETKAYVMTFPEGTENPNNNVLTDVPYPPVCDGQEVNVTHPHLNADGSRITAEEAGCTADWHMLPDSGHPDAAKSGLLVVVGDSAAAASGRPAAAAAIFVSAAVLMLLA